MTRKSWIIGGALGLLLLGSLASGIPQRTARWYTQVAGWEARVTADSLARIRQDSVFAATRRDVAAREARVAERERRDSAKALALASRIAALPSIRDLPDTCRPALAARDSVILDQSDRLLRKDSTIADLIGQVRDERSLRLGLEADTTEMAAEIHVAKTLMQAAPVRPSFWERLRPGIYAGLGVTGDATGVRTGPSVLVGWKIR